MEQRSVLRPLSCSASLGGMRSASGSPHPSPLCFAAHTVGAADSAITLLLPIRRWPKPPSSLSLGCPGVFSWGNSLLPRDFLRRRPVSLSSLCPPFESELSQDLNPNLSISVQASKNNAAAVTRTRHERLRAET
eukprot:2328159-Rhodomonas_salina.1